jgi:hypothetical protein
MLAQIAQRFAAIDRRSNGSHRVSSVYNAAFNPNRNPISVLPQSLLLQIFFKPLKIVHGLEKY